MLSIISVPATTLFTNRISPDRDFKLKASCRSNLSPIPIFLCSSIISPDIMVITPRPPIWMSSSIITCPKTLQEETVGVTTNPVTQVEVVAVKSASKNGVAFPSAELIGNTSNTESISIATRKLNNMMCVVDTKSRCFFILS